ncbi:hypothetical protein K503DRAFT_832462 [Rhizopogon vinicolor AM-OR11-026]|uniref:D-aminoacid aminotransferase-like PLP-dependent enzyme n=1 Tax=Rhizopogon vinicolor AM-OR11-026 TaxID=1314800 RepID=A0A1B7MQ65_9AGAM|nr:hypothetical protein K503DRAFT_832462 [Rhizopogon vinicolor AM-OR11-026]
MSRNPNTEGTNIYFEHTRHDRVHSRGARRFVLLLALTSNIVIVLPTGTGVYKLSANYAPGVVAQKSAAKQGYAQNLWLHGPEHGLTEVGISKELFGTGTAAVVTPVERIGYNGGDVVIPTGEDGMGPVSKPLWTELVGIYTEAIKSHWNHVVAK